MQFSLDDIKSMSCFPVYKFLLSKTGKGMRRACYLLACHKRRSPQKVGFPIPLLPKTKVDQLLESLCSLFHLQWKKFNPSLLDTAKKYSCISTTAIIQLRKC